MALFDRFKTKTKQAPEVPNQPEAALEQRPAALPPEDLQTPQPASEEQKNAPAPDEPEQEQTGDKKRRTPQDDKNRTRSESLRLRLTPEELEHINQQAAAAGMSRTAYVVACTKQAPPVTVIDFSEITRELRKQGTNLNQLAKMANACHDTRGLALDELAADTARLRDSIWQFCQEWNAVIQKLKPETEGEDNGNNAG